MNIAKEYMKFSCVVERIIAVDGDTGLFDFEAPEIVKCFKFGKTVYIRDEMGGTKISAMSYLLETKVDTGSLLDGQVVKSCDMVPNFSGVEELFEVLTW